MTTIKSVTMAVCLLCFSILAKGQIHQPRQHFVELSGGLADGLQVRPVENTAYWARVSLGKYGKKEGVWQAGLFVQQKYYALATEARSSQLIRVEQYLLEGNFSPKGFKTRNRFLYLNPGVGILAGYEHLKEAQIQENLNNVLLGLSTALTTELNFSYRFSLVLSGKVNYFPSSKVQDVHLQLGVGVRFNYFKH